MGRIVLKQIAASGASNGFAPIYNTSTSQWEAAKVPLPWGTKKTSGQRLWSVHPNDPNADSATIQGAITSAASGDVIAIAPGLYNEELTINNKTITLIGMCSGEPTTSFATVSVQSPIGLSDVDHDLVTVTGANGQLFAQNIEFFASVALSNGTTHTIRCLKLAQTNFSIHLFINCSISAQTTGTIANGATVLKAIEVNAGNSSILRIFDSQVFVQEQADIVGSTTIGIDLVAGTSLGTTLDNVSLTASSAAGTPDGIKQATAGSALVLNGGTFSRINRTAGTVTVTGGARITTMVGDNDNDAEVNIIKTAYGVVMTDGQDSIYKLPLRAITADPTVADGNIWYRSDTSPKEARIRQYGVTMPLVNRQLDNWLINGCFSFAQRQVPGTLTTYSNTSGRTYGADRWGMTNQNASMQYQRIDTSGATESGLLARFYGKFKKITSAGKMVVTQVLEGGDACQLRGRTVRVQALLRCSVASSMNVRLGLIQLAAAGTIDTIPATYISAFGANSTDPTLGTNLAYIAPTAGSADGGTITGNALGCSLTTTWVRFSALFLVPTDCKNLIVSIWTNAQPAANDELNIAQISLTDGLTIVDWNAANIGERLERCMRYYQKTFDPDTSPVQNAGVNTGEWRHSTTKAATLADVGPSYFFPTPMRVAPATRTGYNPAAANAQVRDITAAADCTVQAFAGVTTRGCYITYTTAATTAVGNSMGLHMSFDAEL